MVFRGVDQRKIPFSFLKEVSASYDGAKQFKKLQGEPFKVNMAKNDKVKIKFQFYKWMEEPDFDIELAEIKKGVLKISYDPKKGKWSEG